MHTENQTSPKKMLWAGRILSGVSAAFLLFDSIIHMTNIAPVVQAFTELGFPMRLALVLGITELVCLVVHLNPRTSVLGAILLTGYLGGAVAVQLRVGNPLFAQALFPVYMGILVWAGLYLRDPRLGALLFGAPARREGARQLDAHPRAAAARL